METIDVSCREDGIDYRETVQGVSVGPLFVHKSLLKKWTGKPLWTVTHTETGYSITHQIRTKAVALSVADDLKGLLWGRPPDEIRNDTVLKRTVRAVLMRHGVHVPLSLQTQGSPMSEVRREDILSESELVEIEDRIPGANPGPSDMPLRWVVASHRALAARVQEMERERDEIAARWKEDFELRCSLEQQVARLQEALRFYADPHTYGLNGGTNERIIKDRGQQAQQALKGA